MSETNYECSYPWDTSTIYYGTGKGDCNDNNLITCKQDYDYMCCTALTGGTSFQLVDKGDSLIWFNIYLILCAFVNLYLALLIYRNK